MLKEFCFGCVRLIPLCGEIGKCRAPDFKEALTELIITTIFSTLPLWLPIIWPLVLDTNEDIWHQMRETIGGGELLVYCAALVGPLLFIISRRYGERTQNSKISFVIAFPHGTTFLTICAIICILAGAIFTIIKGPKSNLPFNINGILWLSVILYIVSLYSFFFASAYRNAMASNEEEDDASRNVNGDDAFLKAWETRSAS